MSDLHMNAIEILDRVRIAAERANRDPADVTVVAVSKTFDRALMDEAFALGFRVFGESRVQEIREKCEQPLPPGAELHMIGPLQTNKIRQLLPFVNVLQTLDRERLVQALESELERTDMILRCLLQVNVADEEQKSGLAPAAAPEILRVAMQADRIEPIGLMTMAPLGADAATLHTVFGELRQLRDELQQTHGVALPVLSMGMSDDFEIAIAEGATHVRIGRALFGSR